jgi:hypothetical protein
MYKLIVLILIKLFFNNCLNGQSFGRYGDCTTGRGICGIDSENLSLIVNKQKFTLIGKSDTSILLTIYLKNLLPNDEVSILGKSFDKISIKDKLIFIMDNDLLLTPLQKDKLLLPKNCSKIINGNYIPMFVEDKILINLKIK